MRDDYNNNFFNNDTGSSSGGAPATSFMGAEYKVQYTIHLEKGKDVIRVGTKKLVEMQSTLRYYKYDIYCSHDVLIGTIVQTVLMKDMGPSHILFRHGGLCSPLTMSLSGLGIEYRGHFLPIEEAQSFTIGRFLADRSGKEKFKKATSRPELLKGQAKVTLIGKMDVHVCCPCCCTIPKLLFPNLIPWNKYDVFNPDFDFSSASAAIAPSQNKMQREEDGTIITCSIGTTDNGVAALKKIHDSFQI